MAPEAAASYVASRRVGDATITVISEGTFPWNPELQAPEAEWRRAMPEADAQGAVPLAINVVHIRLGDASILVDPGFDDPSPGNQEEFPGILRSPGLQAGLAHLGIRPEEITHVVITHAHGDHFAGVTVERDGRREARFPQARHLIGRPDWQGNPERTHAGSPLAVHLGALDRLGLLDLVDGDREVVPGATMIHAPGETPGHSVVRVSSAGETFFVLGDLFHHACEAEHPDWVSAGRDQAAMRASRDRLMAEAAATKATVLFTHQRFPGWGRIVPASSGYRFVATGASQT